MRLGPSPVLVVAESGALACAVEAALRDKTDLHVIVGRLPTLGRLIDEHDPVAVVLEVPAHVSSTLDAVAGIARVPALILLVDDPRQAWPTVVRRGGVRAVLGRDAAPEQIVAAVQAATAGLVAFDPAVIHPTPRAALGGSAEERALTAREREVLDLMAGGLSNRMIARRLGISMYTVKFHVASILGKLGAGTRTEAVTLGVRSGLISL